MANIVQIDFVPGMSMSRTLQNSKEILRIFEPTERGVVGLVDDLLAFCREGNLHMAWTGGCCRLRLVRNEAEVLVEAPIPKSVFRALLARIAALCNERRPKSVTPYGGQGELLLAAAAPVLFQATFTNTPAEQNLVLNSTLP